MQEDHIEEYTSHLERSFISPPLLLLSPLRSLFSLRRSLHRKMGVLVLDDRDTAVVYSTGWGQAGSGNEFNSTTTHTNTVGATAKVTFYGTSPLQLQRFSF